MLTSIAAGILCILVAGFLLFFMSRPISWGVSDALSPLVAVLIGIREDAQKARDQALATASRESKSARTITVRLIPTSYFYTPTDEFNSLAQKVKDGGFLGVRSDSSSKQLWVGIPSEPQANAAALKTLAQIINSAEKLQALPFEDVTE